MDSLEGQPEEEQTSLQLPAHINRGDTAIDDEADSTVHQAHSFAIELEHERPHGRVETVAIEQEPTEIAERDSSPAETASIRSRSTPSPLQVGVVLSSNHTAS